MKKTVEFGPLVNSGRRDAMGNDIYHRKVIWRDPKTGEAFHDYEQQLLADGSEPGVPLRYNNAGIV